MRIVGIVTLFSVVMGAGCNNSGTNSDDMGTPDLAMPDLAMPRDLAPLPPDMINPFCTQPAPTFPGDSGLAPYATVPYPAENPATPAKAILGKILFWEEQLSSDNTIACGTCHRAGAGGSDPRALSLPSRHPGQDGVLNTPDDPHGALGVARCDDASGQVVRKSDPVFGLNRQVTRRKSPSYLDAMFPTELFWDGRAKSMFVDPEAPLGGAVIASGGALESQAVGPPLNDAEMACEARTWSKLYTKLTNAKPLALARNVPNDMAAAICQNPTYPMLFNAAFGTPDITAVRIAFAIATHERTLISNQTPWDVFTQKTTALTAAQEAGRVVFFGKGKCQRCHAPPLFGSDQFVNLGFNPDQTFDTGRAETTSMAADNGKYRSVTLRNVGLRETAGLLHDATGRGVDLPTLVGAYNVPPQLATNTDPRMLSATGMLSLTAQEVSDLVVFLRTALTDPRVQNETYPFDRPKLSTEP